MVGAAPSASLPLLCLRAARCALDLQAAPSFTAAGVTLGMHIGVTCGPTTYIAVGGAEQQWGTAADCAPEEAQTPRSASTASAAAAAASPTASSSLASKRSPALDLSPHSTAGASVMEGGRRWEFLAVGPAFQELGTAVHDSQRGEVVVSEAVWEWLQEVAKLQGKQVEGGSGNFLLTACSGLCQPSTSAAEVERPSDTGSEPAVNGGATSLPLASFLMPALLSRLQGGVSDASHWMGEYRRISALFVSLPNPEDCVGEQSQASSPPSAPPWLMAFHSLFRTLQQCIVRVGAQVRQLLVDDKGCVVIGAFGLSPLAHDDDAVRTVSAALDLLAAVRQLHAKAAEHVSVGVATGRVWCGAVGSDTRKEYAMVGDTVNLSARIMANPLTHQRVLCEEETVKACGGRIRFASSPEVVPVVKGRTGPLRLWEPLGKATASNGDSPHSSVPSTPPNLLSPTHSGLSSPFHRSGVSTACDAAPKPGSRAATFQSILALLAPNAVDSGPSPSAGPVVVLEGSAGQGKTYLAPS